MEAARLSKLLWEVRESLDMWADVAEGKGQAGYTRGLVQQLDEYRAEQGWSPHGFGGEE